MITKLLLTLHLLGHLIAWIIIRLYLNEMTYISIGLTVLMCLFVSKLVNQKRQPWTEAHSSSKPENLNLIGLLTSWITPATLLNKNYIKLFLRRNRNHYLQTLPFLTNNSYTAYFRRIVSPLQRKIMINFTFMATTLIQLGHLASIALLLNLTDFFETSYNITVAR
jgi:hypothetical protein